MNSSKMKGFDEGFGKQQESLNPFMSNTDKKNNNTRIQQTHTNNINQHMAVRDPHTSSQMANNL